MTKEAADLYRKLVTEHGMPESNSLSEMGGNWYLIPEELSTDPDQPVSTAVFRPLTPEQTAAAMALHASEWALTFVKPENEQEPRSKDPLARLKQVLREASLRDKS
ncbi:MAG: hypothetical protein K8I27_07450 [Planctomycetes bacterium]|nr:hypothetical protein [Planctomycetota bacterium]